MLYYTEGVERSTIFGLILNTISQSVNSWTEININFAKGRAPVFKHIKVVTQAKYFTF